MGTAIYVYETEKEYLKIYHRMDKEVMFSAPILDIFLKPDKKLWVVSKVTKNKERPQLGRSIVNFVNGTSSSSQYPEVEFTAPGTYSVQLVASNVFGSDTIAFVDVIEVNSGRILLPKRVSSATSSK